LSLIKFFSILGFDRPAVSGADRVDEHEVREVKPCAFIIDGLISVPDSPCTKS
jgi:hypothetical protein